MNQVFLWLLVAIAVTEAVSVAVLLIVWRRERLERKLVDQERAGLIHVLRTPLRPRCPVCDPPACGWTAGDTANMARQVREDMLRKHVRERIVPFPRK